MSTPGLTKETNTLLLPQGFQLFHADLTVLPLFSRLSRKLHDPKTIAHSYIRNAFTNVQTKTPKPNHMPEAKASLRRQTHARILSAYPKSTYARWRSHMPGPSAQIRNHKQLRSQKLTTHRKYQESMASSTIFVGNHAARHTLRILPLLFS